MAIYVQPSKLKLVILRCPVYANAGCFTADNIHTEMIDGENLEVIEVHRGCSTWITDNAYCAHWDYNIGFSPIHLVSHL